MIPKACQGHRSFSYNQESMWPEQDKTLELLKQAGDGDRQAVNNLMDRHRDALRHLIRMRLDQKIQRRVDVSDVVQDVLVEANRRLNDYMANPVMPFRLWLRQIRRTGLLTRIADIGLLPGAVLTGNRHRPCLGGLISLRFSSLHCSMTNN